MRIPKQAAVACSVAMQLFLNLVVTLFNWMHLGEPLYPTEEMMLGRELSAGQWDIVNRLQAWAMPWSRLPVLKVAQTGRSADRLRALGTTLQKLEEVTRSLRRDLNGYGSLRPPPSPTSTFPGYNDRDPDTKVIGRTKSIALEVARDIVPSRLKFPNEPSFDPCPLFDTETREAYQDPSKLRLAEAREAPPKVRIRASRETQRELLQVWDKGKRLMFVKSYLAMFRCGLFSVYKSEDRDRMILDARPLNC